MNYPSSLPRTVFRSSPRRPLRRLALAVWAVHASWSVAGVAMLTLAAPAVAHAGDKALAESLFKSGLQLLKDGKFAEAAEKFEASAREDRAVGSLAKLGEAYEKLGKTASAWAAYNEATSVAMSLKDARAKVTEELAKKLEPRLCKLVVRGTSLPAEAVVKRNGLELARAALGTPFPVDPGEQVLSVEAAGYRTASRTVTVSKEGATEELTLPALEALPKPPPAVLVDPASKPRSSALMVAGASLLGVGAAAAAAGGVLAGLALGDRDLALSDPLLCPEKQCSPTGRALIADAETKALATTVLLPAGGVLAAVGATLVGLHFAQGPRDAGSRASGRGFASLVVLPALGPTQLGVTAALAW
jgi:hypothetical protein